MITHQRLFIVRHYRMAVGVGFEPTELLHSTIFKTAAFVHSAIPPTCILAENTTIVNVKSSRFPAFLNSYHTQIGLFAYLLRIAAEVQDDRSIYYNEHDLPSLFHE